MVGMNFIPSRSGRGMVVVCPCFPQMNLWANDIPSLTGHLRPGLSMRRVKRGSNPLHHAKDSSPPMAGKNDMDKC